MISTANLFRCSVHSNQSPINSTVPLVCVTNSAWKVAGAGVTLTFTCVKDYAANTVAWEPPLNDLCLPSTLTTHYTRLNM